MSAIDMILRCRAHQLDGLSTCELADLGVGVQNVEARERGVVIAASDRGLDDVRDIVDIA